MCPPEHDHAVATKRIHALQRTPELEGSTWDGDGPSPALAQLRQTTGNAGLLHLLARRQGSFSVQRDGQDAAAKEAGRRERAARREVLEAKRKELDARRQAREARLAGGGQAPAGPPGPVAAAGPAAAGPVPAAGPAAAGPGQAAAGGGAESMAAKLARFAELQKARQAEIAATTPAATLGPAPAAPAPAPKASAPAANPPNHRMAAQDLSDLHRQLRKVAEPVTTQKLYGGAHDKNTFRLFRESSQLGNELSGFVRNYRSGLLTDPQYQAQRVAWLAKLDAYQQKVAAYKPPATTSRAYTTQYGAREILEDSEARTRQEARWAEQEDRRGR